MQLTKHAEIRWQQRGMRQAVFSFIRDNFDCEIFLGDGAWALRVSDRLTTELLKMDTNPEPKDVIEKARGTALLVGEDGGALITIIRGQESRAFNAYTRRPKGRAQRALGNSRVRNLGRRDRAR